MGFWESAGNIAGKMASGAIDSIQKQQNEINKYRQRYEEYEDKYIVVEGRRYVL